MEFEEAMSRLEEIVGRLEGGEVSLAEALALYEEGVKVARQAAELLDQAEAKVELLLADGRTAPFAAPEAEPAAGTG